MVIDDDKDDCGLEIIFKWGVYWDGCFFYGNWLNVRSI
jgi:hypothetical protein